MCKIHVFAQKFIKHNKYIIAIPQIQIKNITYWLDYIENKIKLIVGDFMSTSNI